MEFDDFDEGFGTERMFDEQPELIKRKRRIHKKAISKPMGSIGGTIGFAVSPIRGDSIPAFRCPLCGK